MVGVKQIILVFLFLQPLLSQEEEDCDPVFDECEDTNDQECDDVRRSFILFNCYLMLILLRFFVMTMVVNMIITRMENVTTQFSVVKTMLIRSQA